MEWKISNPGCKDRGSLARGLTYIPMERTDSFSSSIHLPQREFLQEKPSGHMEQGVPSLYGLRPFTFPLETKRITCVIPQSKLFP